MPPELADAFDRLKQDIIWLHLKWKTFRNLYSDENSVSLLNEQAPLFFYVVQDLLSNDIQLSLAKLTDPASSGHPPRGNLSLYHLVNILNATVPHDLVADLNNKAETLKIECEAIRLHRNKRLAHRDLAVALQEQAKALPTVTVRSIDEALGHVRDFMNAIDSYFGNGRMLYEYADGWGNARSLLETFKYAQTYSKLKEAVERATGWQVSIDDVGTVTGMLVDGYHRNRESK